MKPTDKLPTADGTRCPAYILKVNQAAVVLWNTTWAHVMQEELQSNFVFFNIYWYSSPPWESICACTCDAMNDTLHAGRTLTWLFDLSSCIFVKSLMALNTIGFQMQKLNYVIKTQPMVAGIRTIMQQLHDPPVQPKLVSDGTVNSPTQIFGGEMDM